MDVQATFWALVPSLVAIILALITKEVYSSLFIGIIVGGLFYSGFSFEGTLVHIFNEGLTAQLADPYNVGILLFLVFLGIIVALMNKAGGSAAFGKWASEHIKSRVGAQLATILLGCLIFIDDYFNCLTVGSVMRPVTDRYKVSRAKLAYLIDATAAPVCIIAPISSWAAAVSGFAPEGTNGLMLFIKAIPYNYYALLTILMMVLMTATKLEYGPMLTHEKNAVNGDLFTVKNSAAGREDEASKKGEGEGKVVDLVFPIISLIICCVIGMIYSGGFFSGETFIDAFANCDASVGLVFGSFVALVLTLIFYLIRRVLAFKDCMACVPEGFIAMVPAIIILALAWTLKAMTDSLGAAEYVAGLVDQSKGSFHSFLPAIVFVIACFLAFASGTSWGTFGILIPICLKAFPLEGGSELAIICVSACMAGAVCGDHCSPISDTTIMSSAGAQCDHIAHVSTQLPYAVTAAGVSFIAYLIAGFVKNPVISLIIAASIMVFAVLMLNFTMQGKAFPAGSVKKPDANEEELK
ncbi:MAG: Na+/H+ antiporter NhaC family protein [Lachnospiraceae bacterium]|nr:Na+/H+ antiporter NhaC family protein [Lachnospiraceae bacterium]